MTDSVLIEGRAAAVRIENLDTDQIMPKQFLRGIDKSGLKEGLLHDLRFDAQGRPRSDFVLNRPAYAGASILVGGSNFGCGSSREHAVWGLQQYGIRAIVASSYAEIFHSNAMNNRLLLVTLSPEEVSRLMNDADDPSGNEVTIDVSAQTVRSRSVQASFELLPRHRRMFIERLDSIGLSLTYQPQIAEFAAGHWARAPWLKDVAATARERLADVRQRMRPARSRRGLRSCRVRFGKPAVLPVCATKHPDRPPSNVDPRALPLRIVQAALLAPSTQPANMRHRTPVPRPSDAALDVSRALGPSHTDGDKAP